MHPATKGPGIAMDVQYGMQSLHSRDLCHLSQCDVSKADRRVRICREMALLNYSFGEWHPSRPELPVVNFFSGLMSFFSFFLRVYNYQDQSVPMFSLSFSSECRMSCHFHRKRNIFSSIFDSRYSCSRIYTISKCFYTLAKVGSIIDIIIIIILLLIYLAGTVYLAIVLAVTFGIYQQQYDFYHWYHYQGFPVIKITIHYCHYNITVLYTFIISPYQLFSQTM